MTNRPTAQIRTLSHDGRGISQINGKTVFIENALPGEEVLFRILKHHNKYDEAQATEIITPSPERTTPRCQHFNICGGCSLQHMTPAAQLALKEKTFLEQLQHFGKLKPKQLLPAISGPAWEYRRRARLSVKFDTRKNQLRVGFYEKNGRDVAELKHCDIIDPAVATIFPELQKLLLSLQARQQIPQIEIAIGDNANALVIQHQNALSQSDQDQIISFAQAHKLRIYLQAGTASAASLLWPQAPQEELYYSLPEFNLKLEFSPTDFIQANKIINEQMVKRAIELLDLQADDQVLDLFCGIGNFSLPLAKQCQQVVGIEGSLSLIKRAQSNALLNNLANAEFHHADLNKDFSAASWAKRPFNKILLDPPRTGALEAIKQLARFKAKKIVYVSCDTATFARDAAALASQGYTLGLAGVLDMFPQTSHLETIALFQSMV